jgi:pilus assembly protein CpaC
MMAVILICGLVLPVSTAIADRREPTMRAVQIEVSKAGLIRLDGLAAAVFIADPEVCDIQVKSPSLIYLIGRKPGETTLYAVDEEDRLLEAVNVSVVHNLTRLRQAVQSLHPNADVGVSSIGNAVVIKGKVPTSKMADDVGRLASTIVDQNGTVINKLAVTAPNQVNLRVRVAEIDRGIQKQLGVRWDVVGQIGSVQLGFFTANPFSLAIPGGPGFSGAAVRSVTNNADVNAIIDALANENLISILAEPNLTAMSGESASFLAGGEFPILVPQGFDRITVEFKKFGVSLEFTPTIVGQDRISLNVRPEVSELSTQGEVTIPVAGGQITIPALTVRRAQTTVELGSGQSFAVAGLLQNRSENSLQKYPLLGDIPVIGALFRSDRFRRNDTELVIIVTPYIVRPVPAGNLAAPTDGYQPPSDADRILYGGTHRRNPQPGSATVVTPGGRRAAGPMGFILE